MAGAGRTREIVRSRAVGTLNATDDRCGTPWPRSQPGQVFDTLMVGIFSDMSFAFSAMRTATLRAMSL
jgi:hypothetical protein